MRFRDLHVWQQSVGLVADIYQLTSGFPGAERFGITSQMRRAAVSIPANIAEGHGRVTRGEFINQLSAARGSANELETLLYIARKLEFVTDADIEPLQSQINRIQAMIVSMRNKLRRSNTNK
jgi:four helix bundle protein